MNPPAPALKRCRTRLLWPLLCLGTLAGCASSSTLERAADPRDPFEPLNRSVYAFNDGLDRAVVRPVARAYKDQVPEVMQQGISNLFSNAKYPVTLANNVLQAKPGAALNDLGRLLLNTTLGLGGLLDVATRAGLERYDEDFGQTLGYWGVPAGPYVVVPFLGPYTLRDGFGSLADDFAEPRGYLEDTSTRWSVWAVDKFERRVRLLDADAVLERTGDGYAFVRSAYLQRREFQVRDGNVPIEDPIDDTIDDPSTSPRD